MRSSPRVKPGPKLAETEHHGQDGSACIAARRGRRDQRRILQPDAAVDYFLVGHDDGRPPPATNGVDHGAQAMGQPAVWRRHGSRRDLHDHLCQAAYVASAGASAVGAGWGILSDFWRAHLYAERESPSLSPFFWDRADCLLLGF